MNTVSYTEPQLCHYNYDLKKAWFVHFDITDLVTGTTLRKQFRGGINYEKSKEERVRRGNAIKKYWSNKLADGWSPFKRKSEIITETDLNNLTFNKAVDFALSKCKVASKTKQDYSGTCEFFKDAAIELGLSKMPITDIKRMHIKLMLEHITNKRKWSNKSYNKNIGYFRSVLSHLEEWEIIEYNPAKKIKPLDVAETHKYISYTDKEKERIKEHIYLNYYRFFVYWQVVYDTGIRPKEVLALRIKDIDLDINEIKIEPDLQEENSKTKKLRQVPITNYLAPFLRELGLDEYDPNCYVFGSPFPTGGRVTKGSHGTQYGACHPDYFKPSTTKIKRDTVTKLWKKIVIDDLKINKHLYAAKHTGADDKIIAGVPLEALQELYGHASKFMTEKYARKIKQVYRQQIIEKSPEFIKKPV